MTAKNDCHLKSIFRQTNDLKQRRYSLVQQRPSDNQDFKSESYYHVMMYDDPQFSFCNYYYTYFTNYFAAPYQKLYRAHPISSYSMLLCMLYHLLLKYVNQILFVFSLFLAYYIIDNYYMSVGFKVKPVSREMSTVDLNNND